MLPINTDTNRLYRLGEISPQDDYANPKSSGKKNVFAGYLNDAPERSENDKKKWAADTDNLAKYSIRSHILEAILKIPSYFLMQSDFDDTWIGKAVFTTERITGACGDMFRNQIYGHRDKKGNWDDNVGAEEFTIAEEDKNSPVPSLGTLNNEVQTKGKFVVAALGLVNPEIANDLEWAGVRLLDGMWWRNMGNNLAYGPNFSNKLYKTIFSRFSGDKTNGDQISWDYVKGKFQEHLTETKKWWGEFKTTSKSNTEKRKECLINLSQHLDRTIACFTPVINWLNVFGDIARPIARRLGIGGLPRSTIRILSVIDRPITWLNNFFRFYIPEKLTHSDKDRNKLFPFITLPDLWLTSTVADIFDFGFILGENRLKESSGSIKHLVEIGRRLKDSAQDIYFSARRRRGLEEMNNVGASHD